MEHNFKRSSTLAHEVPHRENRKIMRGKKRKQELLTKSPLQTLQKWHITLQVHRCNNLPNHCPTQHIRIKLVKRLQRWSPWQRQRNMACGGGAMTGVPHSSCVKTMEHLQNPEQKKDFVRSHQPRMCIGWKHPWK